MSDGGRAAAVATWAATPAHRRHGKHRKGSSGACGTLRRRLPDEEWTTLPRKLQQKKKKQS
ncbi:hypothetical protein GCM10010106_51350 [Thermopolyspora flexuosa]|nr:hypothetical protein GCM10010106_51350 [Thermopolyspora flexuosa]